MEFDPYKYCSTSFDADGPVQELLDILVDQLTQPSNPDDPTKRSLTIVDLGSGPGNSTKMIAKRFPKAKVIGLDIDEKMVDYSNKNRLDDRCEFFVQDLSLSFDQWQESLRTELTSNPVDVVFSNYALQWILDPKIICDSIGRFLKPKTGLVVCNILYGDIMPYLAEEPKDNQQILKNYFHYPNERHFIGNWLFAFKNQGHFNNISFRYRRPRSIFPEQYYKQSFVNIPLKWHEKFISSEADQETKMKISDILKRSILKKRITRVIPKKTMENQQCDHNNNKEVGNEINNIELEQELWIFIVRHD